MPIQIRTVTPDDIAVLHKQILALAEYEKLSETVTANESDLQAALFGEKPAAEAVLAFDAGIPVGFALWFMNYSTFVGRAGLYLEDLFVTPERRGSGIGRQLLTHLAKIAVERNCGRMDWSVLDWNTSAQAFYRRLGAEVLPDWRTVRLHKSGIRALAATGADSA